ncbi:MAG: FHA domain-containing protein [Candidatus Andersenbacteria bacterium]|nr:FHA domain-containing protein [Candidatus Andersenbacteria bacterium]
MLDLQKTLPILSTILPQKVGMREHIEAGRASFLERFPDSEKYQPATYTLSILHPSSLVTELPLSNPGAWMFGREDEGMADKSVSKFHFALELRRDGTLTIQDIGSTNGTILNDKQIVPYEVVAVPSESVFIVGLLQISVKKR